MTNDFFLSQLKFVKLTLFILLVCLYQKQIKIRKDEKTAFDWISWCWDFAFY